jgi:hypothetical protein
VQQDNLRQKAISSVHIALSVPEDRSELAARTTSPASASSAPVSRDNQCSDSIFITHIAHTLHTTHWHAAHTDALDRH